MKEIKNININKKTIETDAVKNSIRIANDLAKEKFNSKDTKEFMENTTSDMNSKNVITNRTAHVKAGNFVSELALLILYQTIEESNSISYMENFSDAFNDGDITEGNTKEYVATLDTGNDVYDVNKFIPDSITKPLVESKLISMLNADKTLHKDAYQFKKSLTITEMDWLPYFKSGELRKFISTITDKMVRSYEIFKFNILANLLTTTTPQKSIVGTEADCFRCLSNEVFPEIENMIKYNKEYNLDATSNYVDTLDENNVMLVVGNKLLSRLKNGVESQLFNAQFFGPNSKPYSILSLNNKLIIGDSKTAIDTSTDQYVDEDTIYVMDKNIFKSLIQVRRNESQAWAENMTIQLTLHVWGVVGVLPWRKIFKYTNPNLKVLP